MTSCTLRAPAVPVGDGWRGGTPLPGGPWLDSSRLLASTATLMGPPAPAQGAKHDACSGRLACGGGIVVSAEALLLPSDPLQGDVCGGPGAGATVVAADGTYEGPSGGLLGSWPLR